MEQTNDLFTAIAREHLGIETLRPRHSDSLDFHTVSVWGVKAALRAAYQAGEQQGGPDREATRRRANDYYEQALREKDAAKAAARGRP